MDPIASPRNEWAHLLDVFEGEASGRYDAQAKLEKAVFFDTLTPEVFEIFNRHLQTQMQRPSEQIEKLNLPSDFTRNRSSVLRRPFRRLMPWARHPSPYPFDMAIPGLALAQNDYSAFYQAAPQLIAAAGGAQRQKILVLYTAREPAEAEQVLRGLAQQTGLGVLEIYVAMTPEMAGLTAKIQSWCPGAQVLQNGLLDEATHQVLQARLDQVDAVAFLDGHIALDPRAFDRASYLLQVSDKVVQGLWPCGEADTPYAVDRVRAFAKRYPYRQLNGLNMIVPSALLKRTGGLDARFTLPHTAARELGFRCYNLGAWFAPLLVSELTPSERIKGVDGDVLKALCPDSWERPEDGIFEVPRVSVYIPAYNCAKYIERAVDSVLDQDIQDLEVCLAIDGSPDNTEEVLAARYRDDPRVRFENAPNGGIGHASNRAIHMSRGMYIGQLDSDDCLKPGAVRRLMEYLDENPQVACCYGSCERVDADGNYLQAEYSWPEFTRQKMMVTSIAHHFRMFRRAAWERTEKFRRDIVNAVDYDIFLKLAETGDFHHIDEMLYQRRWHGENTSNVNERFQTSNTYRVQRETLKRLNLDKVWDVHVPRADQPRRVSYKRNADVARVFFWPDYSQANPYQQLLYQQIREESEVVAAPVETALRVLREKPKDGPVVFHLHWTNFLFRDAEDDLTAKTHVAHFLDTLRQFQAKGGKFIWTVHNRLSHDARFPEVEKLLTQSLIDSADVLHFHSAASVPEMAESFQIPQHKVRVAPHGHYIGIYPDHLDRQAARADLGIAAEDEVIVHTGQVRPYKGASSLIAAFRDLLPTRPNLRLVIAGEQRDDIFADLTPALSDTERSRILNVDRFLDENEFQLFYRAADVAVFPYRSILTSGSMLLALSFGIPAVVPAVGMTQEVLGDQLGGRTYGPATPDALKKAIMRVLDEGDAAKTAALAKAQSLPWSGLKQILNEVVGD